jgi:SAM-dependent methyltransferase
MDASIPIGGATEPTRETWSDGPAAFSLDDRGRVSVRDGQVVRAVVPELMGLFHRIQGDGTLDKLYRVGLVRTEFGGLEPEPWLRHEYIPYIVHPQEFTFGMLRDAALCILDTAIVLAESGLHLQDAHPWNTTFRAGKPVYLDFSSICDGVRLPDWWTPEFFADCYVPLWLGSVHFKPALMSMISRMMRCEEASAWRGASGRTLLKTLSLHGRLRRICWTFWRIVNRHRGDASPIALLKALREHVATLSRPRIKTEWDSYDPPGGAYDDPASFQPKARAVDTFLRRLRPGRLIDLACNDGWFTGLATHYGHTALGVDLDENAVEAARARRVARDRFDVAAMNLIFPTPRQWRGLSFSSAPERWRSDTVLMVALAHHLVLRQRIGFEALAQIALAYGPRNLILEFIPRDDVFVRTWPKTFGLQVPAWYNEETLVRVFARHFPRWDRLPSGLSPKDSTEPSPRVMFLFQR